MIDEAKITIKAGKGGDGVVHFYRGRFVPRGGPDGGDGGNGGDVYIETDTNLATLDHFAYRQKLEAKSGRPGGESKSSGKAGEDLHIKVPLGTLVKLKGESDKDEVRVIDFDKEGMVELIAKGGKGGRGNWRFRSSRNTTPMEAEAGGAGQSWSVEMELKILADVGLVGLPNVGKSTLLSVLSEARPKIADYEFTTLDPSLGVMELRHKGQGIRQKDNKKIIIADIPGLIEGASEGRGLGIRFLKHVERTSLIIHVLALKSGEEELSVEEAVDKLVENYETVRKELKAHAEDLLKKKEVVILNKVDLMQAEKALEIATELKKRGLKVINVSAGSMAGIEEMKKALVKALANF